MPMILLYVIAITLICFVSIIFTETQPKIPTNTNNQISHQIPTNHLLDGMSNRKNLIGTAAVLKDKNASEQPLPQLINSETALAETETYHYF